jgi:hypothetical protein
MAIFIPPPTDKELTDRLLHEHGRPGSLSYMVAMKWKRRASVPLILARRCLDCLYVLRPKDLEVRNHINDTIERLEKHIEAYAPTDLLADLRKKPEEKKV